MESTKVRLRFDVLGVSREKIWTAGHRAVWSSSRLSVVFGVAIAVVLGARGQAVWLPLDAVGRVDVGLPLDGRQIFVSDSRGDDTNDGLSSATAVKTLSKAMSLVRSGKPDQVLLKRGDRFLDQSFGQINDVTTGGPSPVRPFVIASYGTGARPIVTPAKFGEGTPDGLRVWSDNFSNVLIKSVSIERPTDEFGGGAGISILNPISNVHIEDVRVSGFATNVVLQGRRETHMTDVVIRRSIFDNAFVDRAELDAHSSGLYASNVERLTIEESVFDHNGWNAEIEEARPTKFNHNVYIQSDSLDVVFRDNIVGRASAAGLQMRPGGEVINNLFIANNDAFYLSDGQSDAAGLAVDNVVLHGSDKDIAGAVSWGIDMKDNAGYRALHNIVAHGPDGAGAALVGLDGVLAEGNVVYDWGTSEDVGPIAELVDPDRTIFSYMEALGLEPTIEAFMLASAMFEEGTLDPRFTAQAVNSYFREGFAANEQWGRNDAKYVPTPTAIAAVPLLMWCLLRRPT
ncbi:MAG: right-handed parallel beta-helix repeat-containing protein [Planctomycetota bacterium]